MIRPGRGIVAILVGLLATAATTLAFASLVCSNPPPTPAPMPPDSSQACIDHGEFTRIVFAFDMGDGTCAPNDPSCSSPIPWSHLTNYSYSAVAVSPTGDLVPSLGWNQCRFLDLVAAGHANCVRVGFNVQMALTQSELHTLLTTPATRQTLLTNLVNTLVAANADGIDMDFEFPAPADAAAYADFVRDLKSALQAQRPLSYVYVAVPQWDWAGMNNNPSQRVYQRIATETDGLQIMGYGYHSEAASGSPGGCNPERVHSI